MRLGYERSMVVAALLLGGGCGGSDSSGDNGGGSAGSGEAAAGGEFVIFPDKIYVGSDGAHTYLAPVITVNAPGAVTWTIDDQSVASLAPDGANAKLTGAKAGMTMLHAMSGGKTADAMVQVIAYTPAQYAAGEMRYKNAFDDMNPACTDCHAPGKGPDHTPTELDADTDEEIQNTYVSGKDPEGRPVNYEHEFDDLIKDYTHMWHVTDDEKVGLIAYLRALPPSGYPEYDAPTTEK